MNDTDARLRMENSVVSQKLFFLMQGPFCVMKIIKNATVQYVLLTICSISLFSHIELALIMSHKKLRKDFKVS